MINSFSNYIKLIILIFLSISNSCSPPTHLYKIDGSRSLISRINRIIDDSDIDINIGIQVLSLDNNKIIYDYNSQKLLTPASTNKLYTCAAALYFLGKDYKFKTEILYHGENLILKGGGDPELSIMQLDSLAYEISKEYKYIDTLFIDNSFLDNIKFGKGWVWDSGSWPYAAAVSALTVNDNCIDFYTQPGVVGSKAIIDYFPKTSYISLKNESLTVKDSITKKFKIDREWALNKNEFYAFGEIIDTSGLDTLKRNINEPSIFAGTIFKESLEQNGTMVKHVSTRQTSHEKFGKLKTIYSRPLLFSAKDLMNESDNLTAELIIKSIGALDTLPGTWEIGLDSVKTFLAREVLIDTTKIKIADGSGLSRYNLTSSAQLNSLLHWIYNSEYKENFISTLPGGGYKNSTLENRLISEGELVRAKTGGLSGIRNLSGFLKSDRYGNVAFSILMNGFTDESSRYTEIQDKIINTIIND